MKFDLMQVMSRLGSTAFKLAVFLAAAGAAKAQLCPPGYYSPNGMVNEEIICPAGYYTPSAGMTSPDAAVPGYYVPNSGSSSETVCPGGYYAPGSATVIPTICPAGSYAPAGSSAPISCPAGYYTPGPGMSSPSAAAAGYYVPNTGSSSEIICPGGYYAPGSATVIPTICQAGYYSAAGASTQTASPAGDFVATNGATAPTLDPSGTWSHIASGAARSASPGVPRDITNHIVGPIYFATPTNTIDLSSGPASLTASNASTDLGSNDSLTALSLLSATLSGGNAADFQINGFIAGTVLYEKGVTNINLSVVNPSALAVGTYSTTLTVQTDQSAPFGSAGDSFNYTVTFNVPPPPTLTLSLAGSSNVVLTWANAGYNLQSAPEVTGTYTTIPGATSPYTNAIIGGSRFFRLIQQ